MTVGAGQLLLLACKELDFDAQLRAQPALQVDQGGLAPSGELVGPVHRIGVAGFAGGQPVGIDAGRDAFDPGPCAGDGLAEIAQDGVAGLVADRAAAVGEHGRPEGGHRHRLDAGGVVVVEEEFRRTARKTNAGLDLQLGHRRQRDLAGSAGVDHIGQRIHKVHAGQRAGPGYAGQLLQVEAKAKFLLEHLVELEVHVQRVAIEAERKDLVFGPQAVVVGNAQCAFKNALDLPDGCGWVVGGLLHLRQEAVHEGEDIGQRAADHWHHHRIEGLVGNGVADKLQTHAGGVDDVAERQVLEVEGGAQVGHDDHQIARTNGAGAHQRRDIGCVGRVLVDHPGRARIEQIERRHRQLDVGRQGDVGPNAWIDLQAAQLGLRRALQAEVDVGGADFAEAKSLVQRIAAAGVFVQRYPGGGVERHARARALAARRGLEEAQLQAHFQIGHIGLDAGLQGHILDAHGEAVFAQHIAQFARAG